MGSGAKNTPVSTMLVDESFATEDGRFVEQVRTVNSLKYLAGLADRWKKDPRPWSREQIFRYSGVARWIAACHHPIVKRLFKQAEANRDAELMAAFAVAFDLLIRRQRQTRYRYDYRTKNELARRNLVSAARNSILAEAKPRTETNWRTGEKKQVPGQLRIPKNGRLFSSKTRVYLRLRVNRYFRRLGFQRPTDYPAAAAASAGSLSR